MDCLEFDCPHRIILTAFDWMVLLHALVRWCLPPMSRNCSFKQFSSARLYFNQSKSCYAFHFDSYPHSVVLLLSSWFISCPRDSFFMDICIDLSMLWMLWYLMLLFLFFSRIYITCLLWPMLAICFTTILSGRILIRTWEGRGEQKC